MLPAVQTWLRQLDDPPAADAAFDDSRVYVPLTSGDLVAVARDTGEISWSVPAETRWPPLVSGDSVFVATTTRLLRFATVDGAPGPAVDLPAMLAAPMSAAGGRLLLPLASGVLQSVADGRLDWTRSLGSPAQSAVTPTAGAGYVALSNGQVTAVALDSGTVRWTSERLPGTLTRPVPSVDRVLVGSSNGTAFILDAATGRPQWQVGAGGAIVGAAATPTRFFITALDNVVRSVDRSTGNQRWKHITTTRSVTAPVVYDDLVVLHGNRPTLIALDAASGEARGTFQLPEDLNDPLVQGSPVIFPRWESTETAAGTVAAIVMRNGLVLGIGQLATDAAKEAPAPASDDAGGEGGKGTDAAER